MGSSPSKERRRASSPRPLASRISPVLRHKGRIEFAGCAPDGRQHRYQLLTRGLTAEQRHAAARLERGDRFTADAPAPLGDGRTLRVRGVRRA